MRKQILSLKGITVIISMIVMPLLFMLSCKENKNEMVNITFDPQNSYTLKETNVETLISDSGVTRYKMLTPTWLIFSKADEPYWYFPNGVYLEKFDTVFNVEASIKADTAYYFQNRKLWQLDGKVDISNLEGERFETSQLFWDEGKETIYSDSFIRITKGDYVNTGTRFRSNQDLTVYQIYNSSADIPVNMEKGSAENDSLPDDSLVEAATIPNEPDSLQQ